MYGDMRFSEKFSYAFFDKVKCDTFFLKFSILLFFKKFLIKYFRKIGFNVNLRVDYTNEEKVKLISSINFKKRYTENSPSYDSILAFIKCMLQFY